METLRAAMEKACKKNNYSFYRPSPIFCTDNAAMIGVAAYYEYIKGTRHGWDLNAVPNLKLGEGVEMSERNTAIVLAAGQGKRMHSKVQKQFLEIQGYPVLYYSLRCFQESPLIQDIILVTGEESISYCKEEIVEKYGFTKVSGVVSRAEKNAMILSMQVFVHAETVNMY